MLACEIFDDYDVLFVDMFGVLWDGVSLIGGTVEALESFVKAGKTVVILSNASVRAEHMLARYAESGMRRGVQFSDFITSGETLHRILQSGALSFSGVKSPKTYVIFGNQRCNNFDGTPYVHVDSIGEADFVYASIPQLYKHQKDALPDGMQKFLIVSNMSSRDDLVWDSVSVEPFLGQLEELAANGKPMLVANPDRFAFIGVSSSHDSQIYTPQLVARQGVIGEAYADLGGEVKFIGKPYPEMYRFALDTVARARNINFADLNSLRIAMVGDTLETDILGAKMATAEIGVAVDSILVKGGISCGKMSDGGVDLSSAAAVMEYCSAASVVPDHVVDGLSLTAHVLF
jgi:HAD superfamily hydrolase (TIGR01450 family)